MSDTHTQAEDRRAHSIKEAVCLLDLIRVGRNPYAARYKLGQQAEHIVADLLAELSRLSRVEQALREAIRNCVSEDKAEQVFRRAAALSASPSSQAKER